ncbi:MAG: VWA domain-containing protein, partial [Roseibium sp.]
PAAGDQPSGQLPPGTPPAAAPLDNGPPAAEAPPGQAPEGPTPTTPAPDAPNAPVDQEAAAGTPDCSGTSASPQTVRDLLLVLDHSKSMALPADANATEIEGLEHIIETGRASEVMKANRKYNQLIANAGTSRLDELKTTVREIVEGDPVDRNWSLITFAGCSGVSVKGTFSKAERPGLIGLVEKLKARPSTPLAKALESALRHARSSGDHSAAVVLVTDGRDTCRGDPCAVAQTAGRDVPVHVVTIGQATQHACIAEATGGQLFTSVRGADLREVLSSAVRTATPEGC